MQGIFVIRDGTVTLLGQNALVDGGQLYVQDATSSFYVGDLITRNDGQVYHNAGVLHAHHVEIDSVIFAYSGGRSLINSELDESLGYNSMSAPSSARER